MLSYNAETKQIEQKDILQSKLQLHPSLVIDSKTLEQFTSVDPDQSAVGKNLISWDFGSCIGVCAKLENGQTALLHLWDLFSVLVMNKFKRDIESTGSKPAEIYIFENTTKMKHTEKVPFLCLRIAETFDIEPKRIPIQNGYSHIIVNDDQIILANKITSQISQDTKPPFSLDEVKPIPHSTSVDQARSAKSETFTMTDKMLFPTKRVASEVPIPDETKHVVRFHPRGNKKTG